MFNNLQTAAKQIANKETDRRGFLTIIFGLFTFFSFSSFFTTFDKPKPDSKPKKGGYGS